MTERGDPRAIWDVVYGCNPDTDAVQTQLAFKSRGDLEVGGNIGVRPFNGNYDFRWTPAGNTGEFQTGTTSLYIIILINLKRTTPTDHGRRLHSLLFALEYY